MKTQSIKKNYILNTLYQILTLFTPLITAPYIARVLHSEGVGDYSFTVSVVAVFSLFAVLGTSVYGQRAVAQKRDNKDELSRTFWEIEILSILSTLVTFAAWVVFIFLSSPEYKFLYILLSIELISCAFDISWLFAGLEQFSSIVIRNTVVKLIGVLLLFILVKNEQDLWKYIAILSGSKFIGNISMWFVMPRYISRVKFSELKIWPHFKETVAYFIPTIAASVYSYIDKVMIGIFTSDSSENGYYEEAMRIIRLSHTVIVSLNTVMSARMSYLFAENRTDEIKEKLEKALAFILTLGTPMVFGIIAISSNFVPWFFGDGFDKVTILMVFASPLIVILSLHNFLSAQYLVPSGQRTRSTKGVLVGAGVNFCLNLILIPLLQSIGAVIATIIAEMSILIVYFFMSKEYIQVKLVWKYLPKQLIASALMAAVAALIGIGADGSVWITIAQVAAGGLVYVAALYIMKEKFFIQLMQSFLRKIKKR